ncbi:uncharacterized protein IL334_006087 [Kwoniella shivajii]|uniref:Succinate dehydrogenase assembly factor 1, mitochondrial n=1 Tax=Kwoniella shivajii TaxID=564305 RepID=A0ABZ1D5M2_9TREE|nr:hypothetical protein IL334_006087 [Kwoniella shivajii]
MTRSGLQQDVINLYRQGLRNAMSKPAEARPNFMLHLRYNFRHPKLRQRDYTAIEHQLRKMSRTLEMLSEPSTQRISISPEWKDWWNDEIDKTRTRPVSTSSSITSSSVKRGNEAKEEKKEEIVKKDDEGRDRDQWAGTLPGHGGT